MLRLCWCECMLCSLCHLSWQCFGVMVTVWSNRRMLVMPNEGWSIHDIRSLFDVTHSALWAAATGQAEKPFRNVPILKLTFMLLYLDLKQLLQFCLPPNHFLPYIYIFLLAHSLVYYPPTLCPGLSQHHSSMWCNYPILWSFPTDYGIASSSHVTAII